MKFVFKIVILLFIFSFAVSAQEKKKKLRYAADAEGNAPFVFQDPNNPEKLIGFEIDIINALCEVIGYEPEFVQNQWDGLIPGLKRDDYDIAINGIEVTGDRLQVVDFTDAYYITFESIVVNQNRDDIFNTDDLRGKVVGALKSSLAERILKSIPNIKVSSYDAEVNGIADMTDNGRVDAMLIDNPIAIYNVGWNNKIKIAGNPVGKVTYAIAIKKGRDELVYELNEGLKKLYTSGKLREILEQWNLWNYQMALYTNDTKESNIKPTKYQEYIKTQTKEQTFIDKVNKYLLYLPQFGQAALVTLEISLLSMVVAILFGLILALIRVYAPKPISILSTTYIEIIRGTPLLIQLFFIYYALPSIGIKISPYFAAVMGLGLNYAAYEAENYRAGLFAVPKGQMEAAISLGMTRGQALRYVIVPQAVRLVIPPITNDFISLLKDSSLVSVITMVELTKLYGQIANANFDYIGTGIIVAVIYLLLGFPFVRLSQAVEKKYSFENRKNKVIV
jgi:polar amino acid transport system substrate-binding protein